MRVVCQCGSVAFDTPTDKPLAVYHCHCLECQKQSASAFGTSAIFPAQGLFPLSAGLRDRLTLYKRPASRAFSGHDMDCYFCSTCGSRVMHVAVDDDGRPRLTVSIKGGLVEGLDWSAATHIWTDRAVVEIPAGRETYPGSPAPTQGRDDGK